MSAPHFELSDLNLPQDLPLSLPSQLVEQRPDVRAAEANFHSSSALVGVAVSNQLPQITLSAGPQHAVAQHRHAVRDRPHRR